jgi:hypothetical protein
VIPIRSPSIAATKAQTVARDTGNLTSYLETGSKTKRPHTWTSAKVGTETLRDPQTRGVSLIASELFQSKITVVFGNERE